MTKLALRTTIALLGLLLALSACTHLDADRLPGTWRGISQQGKSKYFNSATSVQLEFYNDQTFRLTGFGSHTIEGHYSTLGNNIILRRDPNLEIYFIVKHHDTNTLTLDLSPLREHATITLQKL